MGWQFGVDGLLPLVCVAIARSPPELACVPLFALAACEPTTNGDEQGQMTLIFSVTFNTFTVLVRK